ncbi:MAG: hypothetical protein IJ086_05125 [Clostridium sp.]|nr:hypothetical protein [Clostridium sp.]
MKNKSNNQKNYNIKNLEYDIMGSSFLGNLLDISGDLDSSGQNFAMYLESDKIDHLKNSTNKKDQDN